MSLAAGLSGLARGLAGGFGTRQGGGAAAPLYRDGFDADTSGEWVRGTGSVDGVISVIDGKLVYAWGAGDSSAINITRAVTGVVIGKTYTLSAGEISGTMPINSWSNIFISAFANGGGDPLSAGLSSPGSVEFVSPQDVVYVTVRGEGMSGGDAVTLDDVLVE